MRTETSDSRPTSCNTPQRLDRKRSHLRLNVFAMLLILGVVQAKAFTFQDAFQEDHLLFSATISLGVGIPLALKTSVGADQFSFMTVPLIAAATMGGVITTTAKGGSASPQSSQINWSWHKLMIQVKTDHDTWLVGGEMTPFLQALYREIAVRKSVLAPEGKVDEERLTEAIDRMMAMTESPYAK